MTATQPWIPSKRMQSAAAAERSRIEKELRRVILRRDRLIAEAAALDATQSELREELDALDRFVEEREVETPRRQSLRVVPDPPDADDGPRPIRGAAIREVAVRTLASTPNAEEGIYYRTWFDLVVSRGYMPTGKDPLATFLTQISRSPVVRRTTESGVYRIDTEFPRREMARLEGIRSEIKDLEDVPAQASVTEIAARRERLESLKVDLQAGERSLAEALKSLRVD